MLNNVNYGMCANLKSDQPVYPHSLFSDLNMHSLVRSGYPPTRLSICIRTTVTVKNTLFGFGPEHDWCGKVHSRDFSLNV